MTSERHTSFFARNLRKHTTKTEDILWGACAPLPTGEGCFGGDPLVKLHLADVCNRIRVSSIDIAQSVGLGTNRKVMVNFRSWNGVRLRHCE